MSFQVLFVFGTRPEAIKLCPVIRSLRLRAGIGVRVCVTAQHREMLDGVLGLFGVTPDYDLDAMQPGQTLTGLTARLLAGLEPVVAAERPGLAVVQGDTATTLCGALAAFYQGVPVAHVEAGLRTGDMMQPFPEEMNRVVVARLSALHFASTPRAREHLVREGVPAAAVTVTGNPGIDAVLHVSSLLESGSIPRPGFPWLDPSRRLILVTAHRRESFGGGFQRICEALLALADIPSFQIAYPVHPNPNVAEPVWRRLAGHPAIRLLAPLDYCSFVDLARRAWLLLTDSGGVQEEGPSLGKPVLVLREKTERPEAVEAGTATLVGTDPGLIVSSAVRLLEDPAEYARRQRIHNPYGDGRASERIADAIVRFAGV